ncbi:MAG: tRNA 2-thiouridine(34) synthase MnmA [Clostridia bacterium]|nr:tRNA 2-thiouridine(34) synthase MnmA [Clostridia bacterium]
MISFHKKDVLVGFSGGVDSSATVLLLKEQGYNVLGFHFSILNDGKRDLEEKTNIDLIAKQLDIQVIHKNVAKEFESRVIVPFCEEYNKGHTPNPCILCNPTVKFQALDSTAQELGIAKIATGHYARTYTISEDSALVCRAKNIHKDQSYALYRLSTKILSHTLFPLGGFLSKEEVRQVLKERNISNAEIKESQDICFIHHSSYKEFLKNMGVNSSPGHYKNTSGEIIGTHSGIMNYTIGQRKGLSQTFGKPMFVVEIDPNTNTIILGEEQDLYKESISFFDSFFPVYPNQTKLPLQYEGMEVYAKLRYTAPPAKATISQGQNEYPVVKFEKPQKAPTPGQSAVIYKDDIVIGGGIIL